MRKSLRALTLGSLILFLAQALPLRAALPAVLEEMPVDFAVSFATGSIDDLNKKIEPYVRMFGIGADDEPFDLSALIPIFPPGTIDKSRGFGVAIADLANLAAVQDAVIIFVPVYDPDGYLQTMGATDTEGAPGIKTIAALQAFAKPSGKYLIFSPSLQTLQAAAARPKGVKLSASDRQLFDQADVAVAASLTSLTGMAKMMGRMMLMSVPQFQQNPALAQLANSGLERVGEIHGAAIGVRLDTAGINLNINLQAADNSKLAQALSNHPPADLAQLAAMPPGNFTSATSYNINSEAFRPLIDAVLNFLGTDAILSEKIGADNLAKLKSLMEINLDSQGAFAEYLADPADGPTAPTKQFALVTASDADKLLASAKEACPLITNILSQYDLMVDLGYQSGAGTAGGLSYDEVVLDLSQLGLPPEATEAMKSQLGPDLTFREHICKLDDRRLAVTIGSTDAAALEELVAFAKSGQPGLNQNAAIIKTAGNLPAKANILAFMHVGNSVRNAASQPGMGPMIMMFSGPLMQIQGVLGFSVSMEKGGVKTQAHIPAAVIESAADLYKQMTTQVQPPPA